MLPPFPADESASLLNRRTPVPHPSYSRTPSSSRSRDRTSTRLASPLSYGSMTARNPGMDQPEMMMAVGGSGGAGLVSSRTASPVRPPCTTSLPGHEGGAAGPFSTTAPRATSPSPSSASSAARQRKGKQAADSPTPKRTVISSGSPIDGPNGEGSESGKEKKYGWRSRFLPRLAFELENKGSVARDHLASERTFLAWLRTSLGLASIGIAITQLFRLPSNTTTNTPSSTDTLSDTNIAAILSSLASSNPSLAPLIPLLEAQEARLVAAERTVKDSTRYKHLGKPLGGTFIMLALVFLLLGIHRFLTIQQALMREPSTYPPSRRSVGFASFCVSALIIATFVAILTVK